MAGEGTSADQGRSDNDPGIWCNSVMLTVESLVSDRQYEKKSYKQSPIAPTVEVPCL